MTIDFTKCKYNQDIKECPDCSGNMRWCFICEMWSKSCCNEYGTCMCS